MTEMEWLRYLNPWEMLAFIARSEMPGLGRKLLLYAASVCRRSWAQIRSKCRRRLVRVIERFADGKAGERALTKALRLVSFDPEEHPITDLAGEFALGCISKFDPVRAASHLVMHRDGGDDPGLDQNPPTLGERYTSAGFRIRRDGNDVLPYLSGKLRGFLGIAKASRSPPSDRV